MMSETSSQIQLRCEYAVNPLGINEPKPRFSWCLETDRAGAFQSAYQILVASSAEVLAGGSGDLWDSGRVSGEVCSAISYAGVELASRQICHWKVRLWDEDGRVVGWSEPATFEMALLRTDDWQAGWLGWPAGRPGLAGYYRCPVELDFVPCKARLYISGLGLYKAFVNGREMEGLLQPAVSNFGRRIYYNTFDVSSDLRLGENVVSAILGNGWKGSPMLLAQLEIEGPEGELKTVATVRNGMDARWMTAAGPIRENSLFDGETYDARLENSEWNLPGGERADASLPRTQGWLPASVVSPPGGQLRAQPIEPICVVRTLPAAKRTEPRAGIFVFDFGQNHAGWARLRVEGPRDTTITLSYAESLRPDGTVDQDNLRTAVAMDNYILKGDGVETWEPCFTYHGYRYVQVDGWPVDLDPADALTACVVRSDLAVRGEFTCSDELLNRIHGMVCWTEESNLHGIPTDCPQRDERMGWLNDMAARSEELVHNFEVARFLGKFMDDIADTQDPHTGAISDTAPFHWGNRPADPVSIAYLLIPVLLHQHYGDTRTMERHYAGMRRWVDFLSSKASAGILEYSYYGDWAPPAEESLEGSIGEGAISARTPGDLVSTAFYFRALFLFSGISRLLGEAENAEIYAVQAEAVRAAFHGAFWKDDHVGYGSGNQSCNAIALYFDLVPEDLRDRVLASLVANVKSRDYHLSTGNLATKYLLEVLSNEGFGDVAFRVATQTTYPSWGYMLARGATTLWERWEELQGGGMNSHNHPMLGSVGSWFYRYVGGVFFEDWASPVPGVAIRIPNLPGLDQARVKLKTIHGEVVVAWERRESSLRVRLRIPWNCRATLQAFDATQELLPGKHDLSFSSKSSNTEIS